MINTKLSPTGCPLAFLCPHYLYKTCWVEDTNCEYMKMTTDLCGTRPSSGLLWARPRMRPYYFSPAQTVIPILRHHPVVLAYCATCGPLHGVEPVSEVSQSRYNVILRVKTLVDKCSDYPQLGELGCKVGDPFRARNQIEKEDSLFRYTTGL